MKVPRNAQVELCASDDPARYSINNLYLDTKIEGHPFLVATDGRMMAVIPVALEEGDEAGFVTAESLKAARKLTTTKAETISLSANGSLKLANGVAFPRPAEGGDNGTYPNWRAVLPDGKNRKFSVALDAELLVKIQRAMGASGVHLHFTDDVGPILVGPSSCKTEDSPFGVLMPMRMN